MTHLIHWFAQPWALYTSAALPVLTLLWTWARWRRARALRKLGAPFFIARLTMVHPGWRRLQALLCFAGLLALIVGAAGPRWGTAAPAALLSGKDVVVVLDVSRSMLAEQPSRLERARRCLRDLAGELERRGGHRVALVLFASHPKPMFPLTGDYGHFRHVLDALDAEDLPPEVRGRPGEAIVSGTRLGAALRVATGLHDPKRPGWQDILLLSDGDDPGADEEWSAGVQEARRQQIPVHVVATGDPSAEHVVPQGHDVLRHDGVVVKSRLNETLLQEIARRTMGLYFPAHLHALPLGRLLRSYLAEQPTVEQPSAAEQTPTELTAVEAEARQAWFLLPALALLMASMLIGDGPRRDPPPSGHVDAPETGGGISVRSRLRPVIYLLVPALISAAPPPSVEELLRQGNEAFQAQDYETAVAFYAQAETHALDPGLVAFNKAAALFRLGRHADAAAHWQRCLDDGAIPPERRARAAYDLGTALLHQSGDRSRRLLEQAVAAFRQCLDAGPDADLRADALHNLELARWLWLRARAKGDDEPPEGSETTPPKTPQHQMNGERPHKLRNGADAGPQNGADKGPEGGMVGDQKKLAQGALSVLPDQDKLVPLPPEETVAALERVVERIRAEGRAHRRQAAPAPPDAKDW